MQKFNLFNDDCLNVLKTLQDKSIDLILTDPPYGTTDCKWDDVIPYTELWKELNRIVKDNGVILLFGSEPFSTHLRISNIENYKYDLYWIKTHKVTGFPHAKNMPLKNIELISVFSNGIIQHEHLTDKRMTYNPQGLVRSNKKMKSKRDDGIIGSRPSRQDDYVQEFKNFPMMAFTIDDCFNSETDIGLHPTQKPIKLLEYLINTYSFENDAVLDFTMGSGSTGVACINTNRQFIGIEKDVNYFNIAKERLENHFNHKENIDSFDSLFN